MSSARTAAGPSRPAKLSRLPTLDPETIALCVFFAAVLAFYLWIVYTSTPFKFNAYYSGPYGHLADGFLHGQLDLRIKPPAGLLALPDPYDPIANQHYRAEDLHDLSLWHGKFYMYWGPVPALVLFLPLRLVGIVLPQNLATVAFGFGGVVFSVLTLRFLMRRFLPSTPLWALWLGIAALALCNVVPFSLRRAAEYEIAIEGALCFGFLGLWLLLTGWFGPRPSVRRLAFAGLAFGLAVGCRPTALLYVLVPLVLVAGAWRSGPWPIFGAARGRQRVRVVAALAGPLAVCGVLLVAYNVARFGSPLQFGQKYQLSAFGQTHPALGHLSYVGPGLFYYLLVPPRPLAAFPFLDLGSASSYPWNLPADYTGLEMTGGVLPMIPLLAALLLLPFAARRWDPGLRAVAGAMVVAGVLTILALAFMIWGTTQRYEVDFVSLLLVPALLVWYTALARPHRGRGRLRRIAAAAGAVALVWGSVIGLADSFTGYSDALAGEHPKLYRKFVNAFSPLSGLIAGAKGSPVIARIDPWVVPLWYSGGAWSSLGTAEDSFDVTGVPTTLTIASPERHRYVVRLLAVPSGRSPSGQRLELLVGPEGDPPVRLPVARTTSYDVPVPLARGINRVVLRAVVVGHTRQPADVQVLAISILRPAR